MNCGVALCLEPTREGPSLSPDSTSGQRNRLLAAIPADDYAELEAGLEPIALRAKQVLHEPDRRFTHAYFPLSGVLSTVKEFRDGSTVEVATTGREGMSDIGVVLGARAAANRTMVQVEGEALRVRIAPFRRALGSRPSLHRTLLRYCHALFQQVAQSAACNRAHPVDQRCARWLLMTHDRVGQPSFLLTQDLLAQMLGVHRPTVSSAATMLRRAGTISYARGRITILDRPALEAASCECYRLVRNLLEGAVGKP